MPLISRSIRLRVIEPSDLAILHQWRNSPTFISSCSTRRNRVSLEEFERELARDFRNDRYRQHLIFHDGQPTPRVSQMRTEGVLFRETEEYIIIKDPVTKNLLTGKKHPEKDPTFYYIPKALIIEMNEKIDA